ncbi:MAG TPA: hypothetical protein VJY62_12160 [Bacteroidia bacterium]|nr:hypothetical protein [Bacteroidia bacterium]
MKKLLFIIALFGLTKANAQDWSLTGNTGTDPAVNFIGTTDNKVFKIKTNNQIRIQITGSGNVKIGSGTAATKLDVAGTITATGGNSDNWNSAFGWGNHAAAGYLTTYTETDPQVGIITNNFLPRWNGTALVTGSVFDNGTNVGIGTGTPGVKLDVNSGSTVGATARFAGNSGMFISFNEGTSYRGYLGSYAGIAEDVDFGTGAGNSTGSLHLTIQAIPKLTIKPSGDVCIGTTTPATGYKLSVFGKIMCEEIKVQLEANWPDYVFTKNYDLKSIDETEKFINENGHLPGIPSSFEIQKAGGVELGKMQAKILEKVEEQSLHIIYLNEEIKKLKSDNAKLFEILSTRE